ncbi:MAG: response regulator transcription factor [Lachnospiraceae bacterium]|nr:response regulator transcription factor [Lachnospiraceae bacterium]
MKLAICDDEKKIRDYIREAVLEVSENLEIECFDDAEKITSPEFDADILFLDIQVPGIDGMNAAKILRKNGKKTIIIFVTALEEYVFNAFDVGAFQYIVKPFNKTKIKNVTRKAISQAEEQKKIEKLISENEFDKEKQREIIVKCGGTNTRVILSKVIYAEIFDRRIVLHMRKGDNIEYYGRMAELEKTAGKDFFRINRSYLINLAYVKSYDSKLINVAEDSIPVARGKYQEFVKAFMSFHVKELSLI